MRLLLLGGAQFLNYAVCTLSWRAVAQANIPVASATDALLASLQFFILRKVIDSKEDTLAAWLAYTTGGVLGTIAGIMLSTALLKQ